MAFDGITVAGICKELSDTLVSGRISKIVQPEPDALQLTIKNNGKNYKLLLSASASLPLAYLTEETLQAPALAPAFCMLLRKHLLGGKLLSVSQPQLERVLRFEIEHRNELGDLCTRTLIIELMGKHSNLILIDDQNRILDSIKRIPGFVSSIREVLPGRDYFLPETIKKQDPYSISEHSFTHEVLGQNMPVSNAIVRHITGFSPGMAEEICFRASIDGGESAGALSSVEKSHLYFVFHRFMEEIQNHAFTPSIYYRDRIPAEFSAVELTRFSGLERKTFASISELLIAYYSEKEKHARIRQKSTDLRKITATLLERASKKLSLQKKQLQDTEKRDRYRIYGELLNTYGYSLEEGADRLETVNYYTNEPVVIPLDPVLSAAENAKHYFARYTKLKRTAEELSTRIQQTAEEVAHLDSVQTSLEIAESEEDLNQIREELSAFGFIRNRHTEDGRKKKKKEAAISPLHFISSDGLDIYVGKNNYQNEQVTFHIASGEDWWFHAKNIPGSHVIVKCKNGMPPDTTFEEAGRLAAYFSKAKDAPKVEVDYTQKKNLRKPSGGAPGFVVYYTNFSLMAEPKIDGIEQERTKN